MWQIAQKDRVTLASDAVTDMLVVDHSLWVACGKAVWVLTMVNRYRGSQLDIQKVGVTCIHSVLRGELCWAFKVLVLYAQSRVHSVGICLNA